MASCGGSNRIRIEACLCRQNYMESMFGEPAAETEVVEGVAVGPRELVTREYPAATVETRVVRRKRQPPKTKARRRKAA